MQAEASLIRAFRFGYIPGLLQCEAYMREVSASERRPLEGDALERRCGSVAAAAKAG
jgi:hypothetical protein